MDEVDGLEILSQVKKQTPDAEVIIMTGYASVSSAIEAMKQGAFHYLQKPVKLDELRCVVSNAMEKIELRRQVRDPTPASLVSPGRLPTKATCSHGSVEVGVRVYIIGR